ncbi:MAG: AAA family ATPase [bacterium]
MEIGRLSELCREIVGTVGRAIVGKDKVLSQVLMGILADGHILIEDYPGLAKTMMAQSFAQVMDIRFTRIQFTPDLLPGDITGSYIYNQRESRFEFRPGPIFSNLVLADEINRATPKTQSALLEAMQERQVTVEGERFPLSPPFIVIATQNPIEFEGTYPLPEAQLDRFIMRMSIGYPTEEDELEILMRRQRRRSDVVELPKVIDGAKLIEMQRAVEEIYVGEDMGRYIVEIARETRRDPKVQVGASPRGMLALFKLSRTAAALERRDFVTPEDVKSVARIALSHRIILKPEFWVRGVTESSVIEDILNRVPTPKAEVLG